MLDKYVIPIVIHGDGTLGVYSTILVQADPLYTHDCNAVEY